MQISTAKIILVGLQLEMSNIEDALESVKNGKNLSLDDFEMITEYQFKIDGIRISQGVIEKMIKREEKQNATS